MENISIKKTDKEQPLTIFLFLVALVSLLFLINLYNYLLFHTLAEMFSIYIGIVMLIITWNTRKKLDTGYLLIIGTGYAFTSLLDLLHTLSYSGMPFFQEYGNNLPTQLWVAARYLEALTLLIVPFHHSKIKKHFLLVIFYFSATLVMGLLIFNHLFPVCYEIGKGLTLFKKVSEYIICGFLLTALVLLIVNRHWFDAYIFKLLAISIFITILAEFFFTLYVGVTGIFNFLGHICKFISFYLIYRGIVVIALKNPAYVLYHNLEMKNAELEKALENIKTLKGLLPICASCKKIRDDHGYWDQVENYIMSHSTATFTHGLCPDCSTKYYNEHNHQVKMRSKHKNRM